MNVTYISGELLERMKHVEAVEIYDASCQSVIVSDDSQVHHIQDTFVRYQQLLNEHQLNSASL